MASDYYIGIMSGTSFDGIDTVIVSFNEGLIQLHGYHGLPFPAHIREDLLKLADPKVPHKLDEVYSLDTQLGHLYAQTVQELLTKYSIDKASIRAIGSHGQTIRHNPNQPPVYSVQIGDPNVIAAQTGITTIADFRRRDQALGGQGAPLAPAFHREFFYSADENRAVVNIGGFANVTLLPSQGKILGFDTGPGNCFIDYWASKHLHQPYDKDGAWAASGQIHGPLLSALLTHPYFTKTAPKSTGRDEFHLGWLHNILAGFSSLEPEDVQATLTELSAVSIAQSLSKVDAVYLCGGGAYNHYLKNRLAHHLPQIKISTTQSLGIDPQLTEATLMAWLAQRTLNQQPIDLREITGSSIPMILGGVYYV